MKPQIVKKKRLGTYSVSPYNFVSLPEKAVVKYNKIQELPAHNDFKDRDKNNLLSGCIEYTLMAETPIIVSDGIKNINNKNVNFFTNINGKYAIPGNTIRGMIRSNCQILSFSSIVREENSHKKYNNSEITDSRFLFRDVAGNGSLAKRYKYILDIDPNKRIAKNLKAGYIINKQGKLFIQPAIELIKGIPYFRVDEIMLRKIMDNNVKGINYMYEEELLKCEDELKELNKLIAKKINPKENRKKLNYILGKYSRGKKGYKPYQAEISFDFNHQRRKVIRIGVKGKYKYQGYILSGGFIRGKRSHYVVPDANTESVKIPISQDDKETYIDDLILTKKMTKSNREMKKGMDFFALPIKNEKKPVFYINTDRLHFGFTPYLRMFYSKTVLDGVSSFYKDIAGIGYTDAIFGFVNKPYKRNGKDGSFSYKSRVSFEDAIVIGDPKVDSESTMKILLAEPKPTSYNLYLKQDKNASKNTLDIYEKDFRIRGFKQYWLKNYIEKPEVKSEAMSFIINPLKEGTQFKGKIYFTNLDEEELGLVAWALKLNENCYQNIGLAKPYGFGRVKVKDIRLIIENLDIKYDSFSFDYFEEADLDKYIDIYKKNFSDKKLGGKSIDKQKSIKELMLIKSKVVQYKEAYNYKYMGMKEFKERKVLPEILEYEEIIEKPDMSRNRFSNNNKIRPKKYNRKYNKPNINKHNQKKRQFNNNLFADAYRKAEEEKQNKNK